VDTRGLGDHRSCGGPPRESDTDGTRRATRCRTSLVARLGAASQAQVTNDCRTWAGCADRLVGKGKEPRVPSAEHQVIRREALDLDPKSDTDSSSTGSLHVASSRAESTFVQVKRPRAPAEQQVEKASRRRDPSVRKNVGFKSPSVPEPPRPSDVNSIRSWRS
jgi:hypothetical protein